jgi:hypothetical protein
MKEKFTKLEVRSLYLSFNVFTVIKLRRMRVHLRSKSVGKENSNSMELIPS